MKTEEVSIKPHLKVTMKIDSEMLQEVVVTGMQRMDKRLFTGATSKLSADDVKLDGLPEISRALEGVLLVYPFRMSPVHLVQLLKSAYVELLLFMVVLSRCG